MSNRVTLTLQNAHRNALNGQTGTSGEVDLIDKIYYAIKSIIDKNYSDKIELSYDDANVKNGAFSDYFIALHFDGSTNPNYNGGFVDDSPDDLVKDKSWAFAQRVADYYFGPMGIKFAPEHRTSNSTFYYAFNYTGENTKQFLIELGTLTNESDRAKCQDYGKIARLLVEGMVSYFKEVESIFKPAQTPTPTSPSQQEVDELRKQLKEAQDTVGQLRTEKDKLAITLDNCQKVVNNLRDRLNKINSLSKYE